MSKNLLDDATAAAQRYTAHASAAEADTLAHALDAHRTQPIYLGEVVDQLRRAKLGAELQHHVTPATAQCVRLDEILAAARPAADATHAAVADAPAADLAAATKRDEVYGERYVVEVYRHCKLVRERSDRVGMERAKLGQMLGAAERDGLIPASVVAALEQKPEQHPGVVPSPIQDPLISQAVGVIETDLATKRAELQAAEKALRELDAQLGAQLQEIGAFVITDGDGDNRDLRAYRDAFRANHKYAEAQARVARARAALDLAVSSNEANLAVHDAESHSANRHEVNAILDSYMAIAGADQPWRALEWTTVHRSDKRYPSQRLDAIDELARVTATAQMIEHVREVFQASRGKEAIGFDQIHAYLKEVSGTYGKFKDMQALTKLPLQVLNMKAAWLQITAKGTEQAFDAAIAFMHAGKEAGPIAKLCNTLGGLFTGALAIPDIKDPVKAAQTAKKLYDSLAAFRNIAPKLPKAVPADVELAKQYAKTIKFDLISIKAVFGALSIFQGVTGLMGDIDRLGDGGTVAEWTKTIADAASLVGGFLSMTPLAPFGEAISIIAGVVAMIADLAIAEEDKQVRRADETKNLRDSHLFGTGCDADTAAGIATSDAAIADANAGRDLGLTAPQIRQLVIEQRFLFESSGNLEAVDHLRHMLLGDQVIARPVPTPNEQVLRLKPGFGDTLWAFLHLYDLAKFAAVFKAHGVAPHTTLNYKDAFPAGAVEVRSA